MPGNPLQDLQQSHSSVIFMHISNSYLDFSKHSQTRKLDLYFEYEEKLMSKSTLDKSLLDIISDPDGRHAI